MIALYKEYFVICSYSASPAPGEVEEERPNSQSGYHHTFSHSGFGEPQSGYVSSTAATTPEPPPALVYPATTPTPGHFGYRPAGGGGGAEPQSGYSSGLEGEVHQVRLTVLYCIVL